MRACPALAALLCAALPARGAEIAVRSFAGPTPVITVRGAIEAGDDLKFTRFAAVLPTAVVELDSAGGRLAPALTIGDLLARKGFSTYVGPGATCSSACGLIWLAGHPRIEHAGARVGFHAAFVPDRAGIDRENGLSNALIGSYMTRLGLGTDAIMFATAAGPGDMAWITPAEGDRYGIAFEVVDADLASLKTAAEPARGIDPDPTASVPPGPRRIDAARAATHRSSEEMAGPVPGPPRFGRRERGGAP